MEIWFVYCHYKSTGEIFYVGISKRRVGNTLLEETFYGRGFTPNIKIEL